MTFPALTSNDAQKTDSHSESVDLSALEGLRGYAALMILIGHLLQHWVGSPDDAWPAVGLEYISSVTLFFVLSGYTLAHVYDRPTPLPSSTDAAPLSTTAARRKFWWKRMARLAPVYYLSLLLTLPAFWLYNDRSWSFYAMIPVTLLGLQSVITLPGAGWNGPVWCVGAFMICYLFFPVLAARLRQRTNSFLMAVMGACVLVPLAIVVAFIAGAGLSGLTGFVHISVLFRLPQFVLGVAGAYWVKQRRGLPHATLIAELCTLVIVLNLIAGALVVEFGSKSSLGSIEMPVPTGRYVLQLLYNYHAEYILPPIHLLWIMALSMPACKGPTKWILTVRISRWLGAVSYSLYCMHDPTLHWAKWAVVEGGIRASIAPLRGISYFAFPLWSTGILAVVCLLVAALTYVFVEKPARQFLISRVK